MASREGTQWCDIVLFVAHFLRHIQLVHHMFISFFNLLVRVGVMGLNEVRRTREGTCSSVTRGSCLGNSYSGWGPFLEFFSLEKFFCDYRTLAWIYLFSRDRIIEIWNLLPGIWFNLIEIFKRGRDLLMNFFYL